MNLFFFKVVDLRLTLSCFSLDIYSFSLPFPQGDEDILSNDYLFFDSADLCYCIDKEMGEIKREVVFVTVCSSSFGE